MAKRKTILIVEDEPSLRFLAVKILENSGHLVLSAETGDEARDIWNLVGRAIDLLISDIIMPGLSGIQLAEELRRTRPELKIIFVTGNVEMSGDIAALGGQTQVIYKPYTVEILRQMVHRMFEAEED